MLTMSTTAAAVVNRSWNMHVKVSSKLGSTVLTSAIPVSSGTETVDTSLSVPERVVFTVPRRDRGTVWEPLRDREHPLAPWGQRVLVDIGIGVGVGNGNADGDGIEWVRRGQYLIFSTTTDTASDTVTVEAVGLLRLIEEAKLLQPISSRDYHRETLLALLGGALPVTIDSGLADKRISTQSWDGDRLAAVMSVLDSWAADAVVTPAGRLLVASAGDSRSSVHTLSSLDDGNTLGYSVGVSREDAVSMSLARGDYGVYGMAYDMDAESPTYYRGNFNPLPVPDIYDSTLLTSSPMCEETASTRLARRKKARPTMTAEIIPHPGLEARDCVLASSETFTNVRCVIDALTFPLVPDGGPEQVTLREV